MIHYHRRLSAIFCLSRQAHRKAEIPLFVKILRSRWVVWFAGVNELRFRPI